MNVFLKRDQTLELKRLEIISLKSICASCLLRQHASSCLLLAAFEFPTGGGNGAEITRGDSLFSHIKVGKQVAWESDSNTCGSQLTCLSKAKKFTRLSQFMNSQAVRPAPVCRMPWLLPHEPHLAFKPPELHWSGERFSNELFLYFPIVWITSLMYTWCFA